MKLDLPTPEDIRQIVREELAPVLARLDGANLNARELLVFRGKEKARKYIGFTREMFTEAYRLGFIRPLFLAGTAPVFAATDLVEGGQAYLNYLKGRNGGGNPESKAAAGGEAPARKEELR